MAKKTEQVEITIKAPFVAGYSYQISITPVQEQMQVEASAAAPPFQPADAAADEGEQIGFKR